MHTSFPQPLSLGPEGLDEGWLIGLTGVALLPPFAPHRPRRSPTTGAPSAVTHLTNYTFDGARADLSKTLSQVPAFQVTHSFAMGGSAGPMGGINPGTYNFGAVFATSKVRLSCPS